MALLDDMRERVRVTTKLTDAEIDDAIMAGLEDMRRCGIKERLLSGEQPNPLVKMALTNYIRAHYGLDNATERPQFLESYKQTLCDLLNSKANEYLFPEEPEGNDTTDSSGEDGDG